MYTLDSMYNEYVRGHKISREVKEALINRQDEYERIRRAEAHEEKYLALAMLLYDIKRKVMR